MTLASSGALTATQIQTELGLSNFNMDRTAERNLAGRSAGSYSWQDFWGQTAGGRCELIETHSALTSAGQYAHTASIGSDAWNRRVFVCVQWACEVNAVETLISSATIGGIAATIHVQTGEGGASALSNYGCAVISATVPTGSTAAVLINFNNVASRTAYTQTFRVTGLASTTADDVCVAFHETAGAGTALASNTIGSGSTGEMIFISGIVSSANTMAGLVFIGATELVDQLGTGSSFFDRHGCAMSTGLSGSARTVSVQANVSITGRARMAAASFHLREPQTDLDKRCCSTKAARCSWSRHVGR